MKFSKTFKAALMGVAAAAISTTALAETLTVYTAVEAEDLKRYAKAFNEKHPDIEIKWVRDSTGIVTAKLLAEVREHQGLDEDTPGPASIFD